MNPTPIIDMFSGTGELARPVESIIRVRADNHFLLKKRG